MAPILSVLADLTGAGSGRGLVSSLDSQTLATDRFEVVVAVPADGRDEVMRQIAKARPNLTVVPPGHHGLRACLARATGSHVLVLEPEDVLRPGALVALVAGIGTGTRLVAGEVVTGAPRTDVLDGRATVPPSELTGDLGALRAVLPTTEARRSVDSDDPPTTRADLTRAVAALSGSADVDRSPGVVVVADPTPPGTTWTERAPRFGPAAVTWGTDGRLDLALELPASDGQVDTPDSGWFSLRHATLDDEVRLDGGLSDDDRSELRGHLALPARHLPSGPWSVHVTLLRDGRRVRRRISARADAGHALIDGRLVTIGEGRRGRLRVDLGTTSRPLSVDVPADGLVVPESVRGSSLCLPVRAVHVHGDRIVEGTLLLGDFPVRSSLVPRDGGVELHAMLTGLPGTSSLATRIASAEALPLGLSLRVDNAGTMRVVPEPSPVPDVPAAPTRRGGPLRRLRRRGRAQA